MLIGEVQGLTIVDAHILHPSSIDWVVLVALKLVEELGKLPFDVLQSLIIFNPLLQLPFDLFSV